MATGILRWLAPLCLVVCEAGASAVLAPAAHARSLPLVRDSEIETVVRMWADPLFAAAELDPETVRVFLVRDPALNAFVAGGRNLFLNTGLLMAAETPGQVMGVLAHETGHLAGGHLARTGEAMRTAETAGLFATLAGIGLIAVGAATGAGDAGEAGGALIVGGQSAGMRAFLAYTRAQENAADHAALAYLDRVRRSARGLLEFLRTLEDQELLFAERQDPYVRSHPLTANRIAFIAERIAASPWSDVPDPPEDVERLARIRAKLAGFLDRPRRVLRSVFPERDRSLAARYGRAVAYMRLPDLPRSLAEIDGLIAERPDDPWFAELKGQILFEHGRVREALPHYQRAVDLRPGDPQLRAGLGRVQVEAGDAALLPAAVANLEAARRSDRDDPVTWRTLAAAYHGLGEAGASALAAGEYALLVGRADDALRHAGRAERLFPEGSAGWLQAQDIRNQAGHIQSLAAPG